MRAIPALLAVALLCSAAAQAAAAAECEVTRPVEDRPPDDPRASSFASPGATWYANPERTMWAWWWGRRRSSDDYKVLWVRPVGAELKITGRRLDGVAPALRADARGLPLYTYQTSAIAFPVPGCWEIEGTADKAHLRFVVRIP